MGKFYAKVEEQKHTTVTEKYFCKSAAVLMIAAEQGGVL